MAGRKRKFPRVTLRAFAKNISVNGATRVRGRALMVETPSPIARFNVAYTAASYGLSLQDMGSRWLKVSGFKG